MAATRSAPASPNVPSGRIQVPQLNKDPVQSLCPFSVVVDIKGYDIEIPALPAADWLAILMQETPALDDIFPGLLSEQDTDLVEELIIDGHLTITEFEEIVLEVLEVASARDWWVTIRLIETARRSWDVLGSEMILRGVDPTHISLSAWLDVLLLIILRTMDEKDVQMWSMKLEAPPPEAKVEEADMEMSESSFMAMAR